jgi:hypothetical protein
MFWPLKQARNRMADPVTSPGYRNRMFFYDYDSTLHQ